MPNGNVDDVWHAQIGTNRRELAANLNRRALKARFKSHPIWSPSARYRHVTRAVLDGTTTDLLGSRCGRLAGDGDWLWCRGSMPFDWSAIPSTSPQSVAKMVNPHHEAFICLEAVRAEAVLVSVNAKGTAAELRSSAQDTKSDFAAVCSHLHWQRYVITTRCASWMLEKCPITAAQTQRGASVNCTSQLRSSH